MYTLKDYFQKKYNTKVYKISIDAGFTCPNRDGTKATGGCIYCTPRGSGTGLLKKGLSIKEQIKINREFLKKRYNAKKFFYYFQAYSNTYGPVQKLKDIYDQALSVKSDDVIGLIIGTRPDCIDKEKLKLISSYHPQYEVWIEYGLQSIHEKSLKYINRQHTLNDYVKAIQLTKKFPLKITTHIIVGLPGESYEDILSTVKFVIKLNHIDSIKIHSLYIPKNTKLEKIYQKKKIKLMSMEEYIQTACDILEILPDNLIISRITGEIDKYKLAAPEWALKKQKVISAINSEMKKRNSFQGKYSKE